MFNCREPHCAGAWSDNDRGNGRRGRRRGAAPAQSGVGTRGGGDPDDCEDDDELAVSRFLGGLFDGHVELRDDGVSGSAPVRCGYGDLEFARDVIRTEPLDDGLAASIGHGRNHGGTIGECSGRAL